MGQGGTSKQFVGINDYLNANRAQSANLANKVGGYVNQLGDQARSQLSTQQNAYNQAVDQGTVKLNQDLLNRAVSDPNAIASNQGQLQEFQKMRDAAFTGPSSFEGSSFYQPAKEAITKASTAAQQTANEEGQKQLLARIQAQNNRRLNAGAVGFDQALLQSDEQARNILKQSAEKQADLQEKLSAANTAAQQKAKQAADTTAATRAAIQKAFSGDNSPQAQLQRSLQERASQLQNESVATRQRLIDDISQGKNLTDQQLGLLGINRDQWSQMQNTKSSLQGFGIDPMQNILSGLVTKDPSMSISAQNVANADEYARWAALNQLMGTSNGFLSDPSQAGKYDLDSIDFNFGGVNDWLTGTLSAKQAEEAQRQAELAAAQARAEAEQREKEREKAREEEQRRILFDAAGTAAFGPVGGVVADALWRNGAKDLSTHGAQVTLDKAADQLKDLGQGAINTVTNPAAAIKAGANTVSNAVSSAGGAISKGAKKIFSDERLKKDVNDFDASKFLDDLTKDKWKI